jgi:hypothetical protein
MHLIAAALSQHRRFGLRLSAFALLLTLPTLLRAQQPNALPPVPAASRPAAPVPPDPSTGQPSTPEAPASLSGTLTDPSGAVVANATITLQAAASASNSDHAAPVKLTATTGGDGTFALAALPPGTYTLSIAAIGFTATTRSIVLLPGQALALPEITLELAGVDTAVNAATQEQIAEQQLRVEEKQRVFGVMPNFYVSYVWNAAPLTPKQKYRLALRATVDPFTFVGAAGAAGLEQAEGTYSGYGNGAAGYGKRFAAAYGDTLFGNMIGGAVLPSLFHQDPRYFYKGTGSTTSRALYALSTVFRARGDDGHWETNYSNLLGSLAAGAISNAYYPAGERGLQTTFDNTFIALGASALGAEVQEFVLRKLTRHLPPITDPAP